MDISNIITIVALLLGYAFAIIGLYINLKVKLRSLDLKVIEIEKDLLEFKKISQNTLDKLDLKNSREHNHIIEKLDKLFDKLIELKLDSNDRIKKVDDKLDSHSH